MRHRRAHLPERARLAELETESARLDAELAEVTGRRDEAVRHQQRLEDEVATVVAKAEEIDRRLYSGTVTAPRELQAMQADVEALKRRQSALEDEVLEAMEVREPLDSEVESRLAQRERIDGEAAQLRAAAAEADAAIDADLAREEAAREALVPDVPEALLRLYEQLRPKLDGIAVARLVGSTCTGCHLTLPTQEMSRIAREPADAVIRCEQCSRILVRTG